jgi:hypothetical protein
VRLLSTLIIIIIITTTTIVSLPHLWPGGLLSYASVCRFSPNRCVCLITYGEFAVGFLSGTYKEHVFFCIQICYFLWIPWFMYIQTPSLYLHSFYNPIGCGLPMSCCHDSACSQFKLFALNQHRPCRSCKLCMRHGTLNGIMLLLTQPVIIYNYMRNIQATSCFSLLSATIWSYTHTHTHVCMYIDMFNTYHLIERI